MDCKTSVLKSVEALYSSTPRELPIRVSSVDKRLIMFRLNSAWILESMFMLLTINAYAKKEPQNVDPLEQLAHATTNRSYSPASPLQARVMVRADGMSCLD